MKRKALFVAALFVLFGFWIRSVQAGVPLNNLEGVGGIAFNPIAYLADSGEDQDRVKVGGLDVAGLPRFGGWYVNLDSVNVDWTTFGLAETLFKRVEVSYGYEAIAQDGASTRHKNNVGAKVLLVGENANDNKFIPAVSVGAIYKTVAPVGAGVDSSDFDYYLVATKMITQLPRPVLASVGVRSTKGRVTGVFGFDDGRKQVFFGNVDLLVTDKIALGYEYEQGARFGDFKNADYWETHVAWFVNKNLAWVAAYVNAGDQKSAEEVGLGDGIVLSAHYAF